MADSDKNILITPNRGQANEPKIEFVGSSSLPITLKVLDDNSLSWEGGEGQLFSITNNLSTGTIFSVNDISGVPSIEVDADGTVVLAEFSGNVGVGTASPSHKLTVSGTLSASVGLFGSITGSLAGTATQVSQTLTRGSYLTGNNYNGSAATTWAVDATSANTASKVVARDGSGNFSAGTITATAVRSGNGTVADPAFAPSSDTNTGIFFPATHTIAFTEGGVERMRIDSNGDVGIGNTSPEERLHVNGTILSTVSSTGNNDNIEIRKTTPVSTSNVAYRFSHRSDGNELWLYSYDGSTFRNYVEFNHSSNYVGFPAGNAGDSDTLFIDLANSRVGIGTISPSSLLDVAGDLRVDTDTLFVDSTNNRVGIGTASPAHSLHIGGTFRTYFATGTATEGSLTLDDRLIVSSSMDQNTIFNMNTPYTDLGAMEVFTLKLRSTSVASIADEFGPAITFKVQDNNNSENLIGVISAVKTNSANNTGDLVFGTSRTGSPYERMRLGSDSVLTIGLGTSDSSGALWVKKHKNNPMPNISIASGSSTIDGFFNSSVTQTILASVGRNLTLGAWPDIVTPPSNSITITSEGRMGIGETSPAAPLTVDGDNVTKYAAILNDNNADGIVVIKGSTDDSLFITNAARDKVGIGLLPESYKFQVTGSNASAGTICAGFGDGIQVGNTYIGRWATNSSYAGIYHTNQRTNAGSYSLIANSDGTTYINSAALKSLYFRINNIDAMTINSSRKVGINDTNPSYELDVSGTINASSRYRIGDQAAIYLTGTEVQVGSANANTLHTLSLCAGGAAGRLFIDTAGEVGIGTTSPGYKLDVNGSIRLVADLTANGNGTGLLFKTSNSSIFWGMGISTSNSRLYFQYTGSVNVAWIEKTPTVGALDFTGQHRSLPKNGIIEDYESKVGLIVASSGDYQKIQINEALPFVELSNSRNQKNVYGVISNIEDPNNNNREYVVGAFGTSIEKQENDNRLIINSLGEGGIWVTNVNGNFENGDYITSCEIPGYGMKQDSEFLANYTVAKITCDCDFDLQSQIYICEEFEWEGQTYKRAFVGCTYHCG